MSELLESDEPLRVAPIHPFQLLDPVVQLLVLGHAVTRGLDREIHRHELGVEPFLFGHGVMRQFELQFGEQPAAVLGIALCLRHPFEQAALAVVIDAKRLEDRHL